MSYRRALASVEDGGGSPTSKKKNVSGRASGRASPASPPSPATPQKGKPTAQFRGSSAEAARKDREQKLQKLQWQKNNAANRELADKNTIRDLKQELERTQATLQETLQERDELEVHAKHACAPKPRTQTCTHARTHAHA